MTGKKRDRDINCGGQLELLETDFLCSSKIECNPNIRACILFLPLTESGLVKQSGLVSIDFGKTGIYLPFSTK